jgi:taurine transport system substrate-binding protein
VNAQLVAKNLKLHEQEMQVPVQWLKFGSGGDVNRAVAASQLDFGGVGNPPATIGVTRGLAYEGILVLNMLGRVEALSVRVSKNIESLKDLKGKVVAAPFGSTTHYLLMTALRNEGVDPSTLKILDLSPSDAAVAWLRGDIDAAWIWEPSLDRTVKAGGRILLDSGTMAARGYPTWDVAVVMKGFAAKYPDFVAKFVKSECAAIDFWLKNPDRTARIIAEELSLPLEDAVRMRTGTRMVPCPEQITAEYLGVSGLPQSKFVDTLGSTASFLVEQKRLPELKSRESLASFINPRYLEALVGAGKPRPPR